MGEADLDGESFGAQLAQVVGGLAQRVVVVGLVGHRLHLGGEVTDGEAARGDGQRECGGDGVVHAGLVDVDAADAGRPERRGLGQLVEQTVGDEGDVDAVQCRAEVLGHRA